MKDVSCRVTAAMIGYMRRHGLPFEQISADLRARFPDQPEAQLAWLENSGNWISWDTFVVFGESCDRILASEEAIRSFAREEFTDTNRFLNVVRPAFRLALHPGQLYRIFISMLASARFRVVRVTCQALGQRTLRMTVSLPEGAPHSPHFFTVTRYILEVLPVALGYGEAVVEGEIRPGHAAYTITLPPDRGLRKVFRRFWGLLTGMSGVLRELAEHEASAMNHHRQLVQARDDLERRVAERTSQLEAANQELIKQRDEAQRAEARAQAAEERYRTLLDTSMVLIWSVDRTGRIEFVNDSCKNILGYEAHEMIGRTFTSFIPPDDVTDSAERLSARLGVPRLIRTNRLVHKNGSFVYVKSDSFTRLDDQGQIASIAGVSVDITHEHKIEAELREIQQNLEMAQSMAQVGFWSWCPSTEQVIWSPEVFQIFGINRDKLPASREAYFERIHPEDRDRLLQAVRGIVVDRKPYSIEHRIVLPSGEVRYVHSETRIRDNPEVLYGSVQDITEYKVIEEQLRKAKEEAEQANHIKSDFIANMSHEIRTPMTAILGFADLFDQQALPEERRKEYISIIKRNGRHLLALIEDILDVSRVESGKLTISNRVFRLRELVDNVLVLLGPIASSKDLSLTAEYLEPLPLEVESDPTRLRQILINVVGNAIKFCATGSVKVQVTAKSLEAGGKFEVIEFRVKDTGCGISREHQALLFRPFSQVRIKRASKLPGGTGLGLYLSRQLAHALGGDVELESSLPGVGSTFVVTVAVRPMQRTKQFRDLQEQVGQQGYSEIAGAADIGGRELLVVEDHPEISEMVCTILRDQGAMVESVADGTEALAMINARRHPYHVILLDLQLPGMDGRTLCTRLRQQGYGSPIVALTAFARESDREACMAAGFDDFLAKPVEQSLLLQTVASWCAKSVTP